MNLDPLTLMIAGAFVTAIGSILLFTAWTQIRAPALLWWATANLVNSIGIAFLAYAVARNGWGAPVASAFNALSPVLTWGGMRVFNNRRPGILSLAAGPAAWLISAIAVAAGGPPVVAEFVPFTIWVAYLVAAAIEISHTRREVLAARWPLIGFLCLHAFVFLGGAIDTLRGTLEIGVLTPFATWFSMVHFETLIYTIGTATFMVLICKQRSERQHMLAARSDSLTGIDNRGAFLETAERLLVRCQQSGVAASLIMFDLDHFKRINDTFGHSTGDRVIKSFADTARRLLRPNDIFGRYGGEEFVVLLPGTTIEAAYVVAERIRHGFATADQQPSATVSGGVASASSEDASIALLLQSADRCLYRAKQLGRNRVERADSAPAKIARIA